MLVRAFVQQRGSITLLIAGGILPLLIFVLTLGLDLSRYYSASEQFQVYADEATSYASRFLPYTADAQAAAKAYLERYGLDHQNAAVKVDSDTVAISINSPIQLSFAAFFGIEAQIPLAVYSRARDLPFDSVVLLDAASYLGPNVLGNSAWGDDFEWPASTFFERELALYEGTQRLDSRVLTQQCFNAAFSALKTSAIQSYEYLAAFGKNAVGIGVYPGNGNYIDIIRNVAFRQTRVTGPGEVDFNFYTSYHNRNVFCAAAAERESYSERYRFPETNLAFGKSADGYFGPLVLGAGHIENYSINPEQLPYLKASQVLWSQAVRETQIANFSEVLRELRSQLFGLSTNSVRGGLVNSAIKSALIFAGDVPWVAGQRFPDGLTLSAIQNQLLAIRDDILNFNSEASFKLSYILFAHPGNQSLDLISRVEQLNSFFAAIQQSATNAGKRFQLEVVFLDDAETLLREGVGNQLLSRRRAMLSR